MGIVSTISIATSGRWGMLLYIEADVVMGIVGFTGLWILDRWKEPHGVNIWSRRGLKISLGLSLFCYAAQIVMVMTYLKVLHDHDRGRK